MPGAFACPECGSRVGPTVGPGRQVRCPGCATLVEIPFLPRAAPARRWRGRSARQRARLAAGGILGGLALALALGIVLVRAQWRRHVLGAIEARVRAAGDAEAAGETAEALARLGEALAYARHAGAEPPPGLAERRDELARRDASTRLAALPSLPPERAIEEAEALRGRAAEDAALAALAPAIDEQLAAARVRRAEGELAGATQALEAGQGAEAIRHAARAMEGLDRLPPEAGRRTREAADAIAGRVAERFGLVAELPRGRFFLGSPGTYRTALLAPVLEVLAGRGYVPAPADGPWHDLWDQSAPNRLVLEINEQPIPYLQSANRGTSISTHLELTRRRATLLDTQANAQTRMPPPGMPAYEARLIATAPRRSTDVERRLQRDALDQVLARLATPLHSATPADRD